MIREKVELTRKAVGPILVLTYKNHSLDKFLIDVIEHFKIHKPGMFIRTGKPEMKCLERYTEKKLSTTSYANYELLNFIHKNTRNVIKELLKCAKSLETSFEVIFYFFLLFKKIV